MLKKPLSSVTDGGCPGTTTGTSGIGWPFAPTTLPVIEIPFAGLMGELSLKHAPKSNASIAGTEILVMIEREILLSMERDLRSKYRGCQAGLHLGCSGRPTGAVSGTLGELTASFAIRPRV